MKRLFTETINCFHEKCFFFIASVRNFYLYLIFKTIKNQFMSSKGKIFIRRKMEWSKKYNLYFLFNAGKMLYFLLQKSTKEKMSFKRFFSRFRN